MGTNRIKGRSSRIKGRARAASHNRTSGELTHSTVQHAPPSTVKDSLPARMQADDAQICRVCGGEAWWWRKNEPNSKWICGICHPPAEGLDVLLHKSMEEQ